MSRIDEILNFWLGEINEVGLSPEEKSALWWGGSDALDQDIRERFGADLKQLSDGELEGWRETPRGALAYIILCDQFSRNIHRRSGQMYACDDRATAATRALIDARQDRALRTQERFFAYMPLMHSESLCDQELCIRMIELLIEDAAEVTHAQLRNNLNFAHQHRDIVARFGRFPHRNDLLGRESTAEEAEFLTQPGSSF